jgi:hypothetical protein
MELKDPSVKTQALRINRVSSSQLPVERPFIGKRGNHEIEQTDRGKVIHAVGKQSAAFDAAKVAEPGRDCRWPTEKAKAAGSRP